MQASFREARIPEARVPRRPLIPFITHQTYGPSVAKTSSVWGSPKVASDCAPWHHASSRWKGSWPALSRRGFSLVGGPQSKRGGEKLMPYYLVQAAFTKELIESLDEHPHNRLEEVRPVYEELGITIREGFLAFGEYDVVLLCEAPDNVHMAAIAMAVTAGGAITHYKTTPLLTLDEGVEAMRLAGGSSYTPPS